MKKRLLSILLALVMALSLLPTAAMAVNNTQSIVSTGSDDNVAVTKSALPNGNGTYDITITVTPKTEGVAKPLELVLLLDVSGSMAWCTQEDHEHDEDCEINLTCTKEEHWHSSRCYERVCNELHLHSDECYQLICTKEEHYHTFSCYAYSCGKHEHRYGGSACAGVEAGKPSRLASAVAAASSLVNTLVTKGLSATVSIVTFSSSASTVLSQQAVTNAETAKIVTDQLATLGANGGTYMEPGVKEAAKQFSNDQDTHKVLVMLADGDNDSADDKTIKAAEGMKDAGVDIYTIAFTQDIDIMEELRANNGTYSVAGDETALSGIFAAIANDMTAKLTDSMGSYVDLVGTVTAGSGSASVSGDTITWQLATLKKDVRQTITYRVAVDVKALNVGENTIDLNGSVGLTYKLGKDEKTVSVTPPQDTVYVGRLTEKIFVDGTEVTKETKVGEKVLITGSKTFTWNAPAATYNGAAYVETKYDGVATAATSVSATSGEHVVAHYYSSGYTLTYDVNGGNNNGPERVQNLSAQIGYSLNTTTKPTHAAEGNVPVVFIGWTAEQDQTIYAKNDTAPACITTVDIAGNTTVYAVYGLDTNNNGTADVLEDKYTVTYQYTNTVAGAPEVPAQETGVLAGTAVNVADVPTLAGYTFDGWTTSDADIEDGRFTMPNKDVTLSGKFSPRTDLSYKVNYLEQGTNKELATAKTVTGKTFNTTVTENAATVTGYTVVAPATQSLKLDAYGKEITFYYTVNSHTVTYKVDGETYGEVTSYNYGTDVTVNQTPSKEGYTFNGWTTEDVTVTSGKFTMPDKNVTLSGSYTPKPITVYLGSDEGEYQWVMKNLTGSLPKNFEETFTVTLTPAFEVIEVNLDAPVAYAVNETAEILQPITGTVTMKNKGAAVFEFTDGLTFNTVGEYKFTVKETAGSTKNMKYDGTEYTLIVSVTEDHNKGLVAAAKPVTVTNQYTNPTPYNPPVAPKLNKADHYAYVVGYPDGTVQPQGAITRAEVATIFFRLLSDETRDLYWTKNNAYTDVKAGDWFNNAVSTLSNAGIINGYPDGTFRPNAPITRAEMAKVIAMFAELDKDSEGFKDIAGHWAEAYIKLAAGNGWIAGYPDGTFRPDQYITRAETMTMINRVLERVPSEEEHLLSHRVMLTFPDNQPGDWYYIAVQEATNSHTYERYATEKNGDEQWIKLIDNYDWTKLEF